MEQTKKTIEIPIGHAAIRENSTFMNELADKLRTGEWNHIDDVREYLEFHGYRPDTVARFVHGVELRLGTKYVLPKENEADSGELPKDRHGNHIRPKKQRRRKQADADAAASNTDLSERVKE